MNEDRTTDLPPFFFRIRENGAAVYRVSNNARSRRLEMDHIAVVNIRNGEIKPQRGQSLSDEDLAAIQEWTTARQETLGHRERTDVDWCIERLNLTAQWAQSKATPEDLDAVSEKLLLAMHDLRSVLVRKKAERLSSASDDTTL